MGKIKNQLGINYDTLKYRVYNWNDIERAFTTPVKRKKELKQLYSLFLLNYHTTLVIVFFLHHRGKGYRKSWKFQQGT